MTNREAIEILKDELENNETYARDYGIEFPLSNDAYKLAIQALEKQEPKKPIRDEIEDIIRCPNCKSSMLMDNVCFKCGQALDWEGYKNDK